MHRRVSLTLIAFIMMIVVLIGARYQWARSHRTGSLGVNVSQRDSLRRDSIANGEAEPADTMCFASRLGFPCDQN